MDVKTRLKTFHWFSDAPFKFKKKIATDFAHWRNMQNGMEPFEEDFLTFEVLSVTYGRLTCLHVKKQRQSCKKTFSSP